MSKVAVHYYECNCGESESNCSCEIICHQWVNEPDATSIKHYVTCKNCLRIMRAAISSPENHS